MNDRLNFLSKKSLGHVVQVDEHEDEESEELQEGAILEDRMAIEEELTIEEVTTDQTSGKKSSQRDTLPRKRKAGGRHSSILKKNKP